MPGALTSTTPHQRGGANGLLEAKRNLEKSIPERTKLLLNDFKTVGHPDGA
jgi:hypothetical protein